MSFFDPDPVDPLKEAQKQYYRDNPREARNIEGTVWLVIGAVFILGLCISAFQNFLKFIGN